MDTRFVYYWCHHAVRTAKREARQSGRSMTIELVEPYDGHPWLPFGVKATYDREARAFDIALSGPMAELVARSL